ncbi:DUF5398 family protein [Candidatus Neptunochlamydia vexilliferae]|uniref:Needle chaperone SctE n=1 Tax=Candidatus Neptunichlamydia vexilliferae TaxID=1651774 RepID=A0ABS0AZ21_9BACT|nr:DUF5398 family protein [Candidatus Neptunochlamydia vexilliferae]MBF5059366.1 hypothetical protein [Candidatus Neptunochlamydia vexilliferae]
MFGLEKDDKPPRFEFDLEKDLKSSKEKKKVLDQIDAQTNQLKTTLREGAASENFDKCGVLLQAYGALKRVVERTTRK